MTDVSFITSNPNKFREMSEFFKASKLTLKRLNMKPAEIQADSLGDVVLHSLSQVEQENVFIEDAGFFIDELKGFPGVYSRYVFDTIGNDGTLKLLENIENRMARFVAVIGYKPEAIGDVKLFKGEVKGYVSNSPRGNYGFGYDPIFIPEGFKNTFGEDKQLKSNVSHRRKVAQGLIEYLKRKR